MLGDVANIHLLFSEFLHGGLMREQRFDGRRKKEKKKKKKEKKKKKKKEKEKEKEKEKKKEKRVTQSDSNYDSTLIQLFSSATGRMDRCKIVREI